MNLEGKVILVAGAGPGIGEGVVKVLASEGASVAVVDINETEAKRIAVDVIKVGPKAVGIKANLMEKADCENAVKATVAALGKLDGVVNIVGGLGAPYFKRTSTDFVDATAEEWDVVFQLNLMTAVFMCQAVIPIFRKQGYGKIINTGSECGQYQHQGMVSSYCCSKAAVIHFSRNLAFTLAKENINVNVLCPGRVFTPGFHDRTMSLRRKNNPDQFKGKENISNEELFLERAAASIPLKRPQTPEDMGHGCAFLLSDGANNVTGMLMNIDGGTTV
ncbi:SDR family NAD(P)-dependent oxidoreductase [Chloroflexota bacterium]